MGSNASKPKAGALDRPPSKGADPPPSDPATVQVNLDSTVSEETLDSSAGPAGGSGSGSGVASETPANDPAAADARKKVQVIRVDKVETFEDDTNQTGLSEYEIRKQDQFYHTPYRRRGRAYNEAAEADRKKAEEKKAKKEEKKAKRRSKRGSQEPEVIEKNTVAWALQSAKKLGVLNLAKMNLESFPGEIFEQMPGTARIINISMNRMSTLDPRMYEYVLVQRLIANHNHLASIHPKIGKMVALKKLDLAHNQLSELPDSFAQLKQLELVDLSHNKLTGLPPSFAELDLTDLNLSANKFAVAPPEIEPMESLLELDLSDNNLTVVPQAWMSFSRLISLRLDNNGIQDFPAVILQLCPDLTTLRLRGNPIKMADLEAKDMYQTFEDRRRATLKRQVEAGTINPEDLLPADR